MRSRNSSLGRGGGCLNASRSRRRRRRRRRASRGGGGRNGIPALLAARGDGLEHARKAGLPREEAALEELPLRALERAGAGTSDVQRLRGLRELAGEEARADDW